MKIIKGGVTEPLGFLASGIHCGLKKRKEKLDLALIYSKKICNSAAVYTKNIVKGTPITPVEATKTSSSNKFKLSAVIFAIL